MNLINPKLSHASDFGRTSWSNYYAGYSDRFVKSALDELRLSSDAQILDPWNGSGTTTDVCNQVGLRSTGIDINPVMIVAAKARLISGSEARRLHKALLSQQVHAPSRRKVGSDDPLTSWFSISSVAAIRSIEHEINFLFCKGRVLRSPIEPNKLSIKASCCYLALFRTVRQLLERQIGSNPTWIKIPETTLRISIRSTAIRTLYFRNIDFLLSQAHGSNSRKCLAEIVEGDSTAIPYGDAYFDAAISSPPYLTRIDYGVATRPELCVLGYSHEDLDNLRHRIIGTTVVCHDKIALNTGFPEPVQVFLDQVRRHPSRASNTYYLRTYIGYFERMAASLTEISRVLKTGAPLLLVAQDSYYKEVHADLSAYLTALAEQRKFRLLNRHDFIVKANLGYLNSRARRYNATPFRVESVLVLERK